MVLERTAVVRPRVPRVPDRNVTLRHVGHPLCGSAIGSNIARCSRFPRALTGREDGPERDRRGWTNPLVSQRKRYPNFARQPRGPPTSTNGTADAARRRDDAEYHATDRRTEETGSHSRRRGIQTGTRERRVRTSANHRLTCSKQTGACPSRDALERERVASSDEGGMSVVPAGQPPSSQLLDAVRDAGDGAIVRGTDLLPRQMPVYVGLEPVGGRWLRLDTGAGAALVRAEPGCRWTTIATTCGYGRGTGGSTWHRESTRERSTRSYGS